MYKFLKENRIKVLLIPLILYWILLFIGTSLPSDNLSFVFEFSDKAKHFLAYMILASLLALNFYFQEKYDRLNQYYLIFSLAICSIYGIFDELHQILVPNRSAELYDWIADVLGSITGIILVSVFIKYLRVDNSNIETS